MTNSIQEIEQAEVLLVIGSNTTEAHPVISYYMKRARKRGATLIVCDPRVIDLCRWADIHVQHRIGSDIALVNGLMHEIIEQRLGRRGLHRRAHRGLRGRPRRRRGATTSS